MPAISVSPLLRAGLVAALQRRLAQLPPGPAAALRSTAADAESEEALRRLSVPLRTRLLQRALQEDESAQVLDALAVVGSRADWSDLRYLDAFNVCFESWSGDYLVHAREHFLALYRAVLQRALAQA